MSDESLTSELIHINEQQARLERLNQWLNSGVNPYPSLGSRTHTAKDCHDGFEKLTSQETVVTLTGRLRAIRLHGGSCFAVLEDITGQVQVYGKQDTLGQQLYERFSQWLDIGDFIQVTGTLFKTKTGEITVAIKSFNLLTKTLTPLPEKWHGLQDIEQRYRYRHLDLLANSKVREVFYKRTKIITFFRNYLNALGFMEVDTPVLQTVASGAIARPFVTHHQALDVDMYLRVAPELYLKRLLIGGYEKVYEVARCFRNEGIDYAHNPEFTQIELYWAYTTYEDLMKLVEDMMFKLLMDINTSSIVKIDDQEVEFKPPFTRLDFKESYKKYLDIDIDKHQTIEELTKVADKKGLQLLPEWGRGKILDELFKEFIRPQLIQPTFLINHPVDLSPLAKQIDDRPNYVERMQLIVGGRLELCNGFSELNDPLEQTKRFNDQKKLRQGGDEEAMASDDSFIEALRVGMPPAAGLGIGLDRLIALITEQHNLKDVILFPTLKPLINNEDNNYLDM